MSRGPIFRAPLKYSFQFHGRERIGMRKMTLSHFCALKRWIERLSEPKIRSCATIARAQGCPPGGLTLKRKEFLQMLTGIPAFGSILYAGMKRHGWESHEVRALAAQMNAAIPAVAVEPKGQIPHAKIGKQEFSRVMLGGNLIGGWAHARDLIYADRLVKSYHTKEKIFETLAIAEKHGFNCQFLDITNVNWLVEYRRQKAGNFKFIIQANNGAKRSPQDYLDVVKQFIDEGASGFYMQSVDRFLAQKQYDLIAQTLELGRRNGLPVGLGSHGLPALKEALAHDLVPDFWMKTFHHHEYWSADPALPVNDNVFCESPEEIVAFMKERKEPWIAFKTLAAGALHPKDGVRFAFANGADFACVGMFDFQVAENAAIFCDILSSDLSRPRPWRA